MRLNWGDERQLRRAVHRNTLEARVRADPRKIDGTRLFGERDRHADLAPGVPTYETTCVRL